MAVLSSSSAGYVSKKSRDAAVIIARQDRLPIWAFSRLFIGIIGLGFLFTQFEIGEFDATYIQACVEVIKGCTPQTVTNFVGLPVLANLVGYMIGALALGPFANRYGRKDLLVTTMIIAGLGSLYNAFVGDYGGFILARTITGIGTGADIALVSTYICELAPSQSRAKYMALIYVVGTIGFDLAVWIGFYLTTPPAPFPFGLPFTIAGPNFLVGWRVLYGAGALLGVTGLLVRSSLPESPRWLITQGRLTEADLIVSSMEKRAQRHMPELPPISPAIRVRTNSRTKGYSEIFQNPLYLKRMILLTVIWLTGYISLYGVVAGQTIWLVVLGFSPPVANLISAIAIFGNLIGSFIIYRFSEMLERKHWIVISGVLMVIGGIIVASSHGTSLPLAISGAALIDLSSVLWVPTTYAWSAENFPTRSRTSGFALVDGIGHVGGGIGVVYLTTLVFKLGPSTTFMIVGVFLVAGGALAQFGISTRRKRLDEVSP